MKAYHQLLVWDIATAPPVTRLAERLLNPVLGKSLVVYATQAHGRRGGIARPSATWRVMPVSPEPRALPEVPGILTAAEVAETVDAIAEWQLPTGMIPWFPGGHADPWNHVEAAMALDLGGRRAEAERAYEWLADLQRARRRLAPVLPGRPASSRTSSTPTPSPTSPPACGTTGC